MLWRGRGICHPVCAVLYYIEGARVINSYCFSRFMTVEGTSKNRIISPGKVLHFYNSPPDSTMESLKEVFGKVSVQGPMGIKFFSQG